MSDSASTDPKDRAARSGGRSDNVILERVAQLLKERRVRGELAVDLGCGHGSLQPFIAPFFPKYLGLDVVRYETFPAASQFIEADLNAPRFPIDSKIADAVFAIETIEHLENPRALLREMVRIAKPGAWIIVTTPNQLSFLSLGTLIWKRRFSAFQDVHYPAHITSLLESDLLRIAAELQIKDTIIEYSLSGRVVLTPFFYPQFISRLLPRFCSDNVLLIGRAP